MPILIVALVALAVFGIVGVLLLAAMLLEHRMHHKQEKLAGVAVSHLPFIKH